jgi:MFS family permease
LIRYNPDKLYLQTNNGGQYTQVQNGFRDYRIDHSTNAVFMRRVLPVIVISQFFCTSLWFAGNAIMPDIAGQFHLPPTYVANLTSAVQFGFISGTLVFAILSIADRISPSRIFFSSALVAAACNLVLSFESVDITVLLLFRFLTGFFLAGIYPVGMKIAADHYQQKLGKSLGFLVGALVLGTAFPHFLKTINNVLPWKWVVYATSLLSCQGGLAILLLVPDGPFRKPTQKPSFTAFLHGFRNKEFRAAAFGYFGHMWELYAFWTFVPLILSAYRDHYPQAGFDISLLSFLVISAGAIACVAGGMIAQRYGEKRTATWALLISCSCCLLSPFFLFHQSTPVLLLFMFIWGMSVVADSPLFSTLVANHAPPASKGASLTIVNCIGFSITIVSIQLMHVLLNNNNRQYIYTLLAIGPILGLIALTGKGLKRS